MRNNGLLSDQSDCTIRDKNILKQEEKSVDLLIALHKNCTVHKVNVSLVKYRKITVNRDVFRGVVIELRTVTS